MFCIYLVKSIAEYFKAGKLSTWSTLNGKSFLNFQSITVQNFEMIYNMMFFFVTYYNII